MFQTMTQAERSAAGTYLSTKFPVGSELCLFVNDYTPTPFTVLADLTEATFGGYARPSSAAAYQRIVNPDMSVGVVSVEPAGLFQADNSIVGPETAYGCFVLNASGGLVLTRRFDTPIIFAVDGDSAQIIWPTVNIPVSFGEVANFIE